MFSIYKKDLQSFFFTPFASIITLISQYITPLILLVGHTAQKRKLNSKVVNNEKVKNSV